MGTGIPACTHTGTHTKTNPPVTTKSAQNRGRISSYGVTVTFVFFLLLSLSVILPQILSVIPPPHPHLQYNDIDITCLEELFGCVPAHHGSEVWVSRCALSTASASVPFDPTTRSVYIASKARAGSPKGKKSNSILL